MRNQRMWWNRLRQLLLVLAIALVAVALGIWHQLRSSLPALEGEIELSGLSSAVIVERDALGVPTLAGENRLDLSRALGFVHAQERFFQMDLLRRTGAGELAELLGPNLLSVDRRLRLHRFRQRSKEGLSEAPVQERDILEAYAEGVNAGLEHLTTSPFEYLILRSDPEPWLPEDTFLVVMAMFFDLQDARGTRESAFGVLHDVLPEELAHFLDPGGTSWDAPIEGDAREQPPIPSPDIYDLRKIRVEKSEEQRARVPGPPQVEDVLGSNNWAVSGEHTATGHALLANDMHLGISVPNTWFRVSLRWTDESQSSPLRQMTGVTLPGTPAVVVGSNGHVAWGFTNSYGDYSDLVVLEPDPASPEDSYLTPDGSQLFETHLEILSSSDGQTEELEVLSTIWGPVVDEDYQGRRRALRWTAHLPGAVNLGFFGIEVADDLESAMQAANLAGGPAQNFVAADSRGRIGWTTLGRIPQREGFDGHLPTSWSDGSRRWSGWLETSEVPRIVDPESGRIWTANARVVDGEALAKQGDADYVLGARAQQIRDDLFALDKATVDDLLAIQLDDRAVFLERWRGLLLDILGMEAVAGDPRREELRRLVEETWTGHASVDSPAYRLVRAFRLYVGEAVLSSLLVECVAADERLDGFEPRQWEGPVWALVTEQPLHLLDPDFESWQDQLLAVIDTTLDHFEGMGGALADHTWGERNTVRIRHPLSAFLPFPDRWLDMPSEALPGDWNMPRAQTPSHGASERMIVSPGHEQDGSFHMPSGQSGHPLSPYYGAGHESWARGKKASFLPGESEYLLTLLPASEP